MTDNIVDRGTAALIESLYIKCCGIAAVITGEFVDPLVNILGCNASFNSPLQHVQSFSRQLTTSTDAFNLFIGFDNNP